MDWYKINITAVLEVLRQLEKTTPVLTPTQSIIYSDGIEELTITYKRLKEETNSAPSQETKPSTSSICDNSADVGKANRLRVDKPLDNIHTKNKGASV